jgi:predicted alpha-1,6-mannanase (GH76 family)
MRLTVLSVSLALLIAPFIGCAQLSPAPDTATLRPLGVAEDRDIAAVTKLLTYYDANTGAWNTPTGEAWQPALGIDAVINTYQRTKSAQYLAVINKSFSHYVGRRSSYYDDDGWYLNAWIRAWDVTGDSKFLGEATSIFSKLTGGWDNTCGGGLWWNSDRNYKNAITNELFLLAAARLHRRAPNGTGAGSYYDWAFKEWNWFKNSGLINAQRLVNDGLTGSCQNNGGTTWTYNQGVILGGLVELWRISGDRAYLFNAEQIAEATINNLVYPGGILKEPLCETTSCGGGDHFVFKGPFVQGLARLYNADRGNKPVYGTFLTNNANSVWNNSRDSGNGLGFIWKGPVGGVNEATQAAATLLIGEVALLNAGGETTNPPVSSGTVLEAENAVLHNLSTESTYAGYSGSGYIAGWNADAKWVDFTFNSASARTAIIVFRYAGGAGNASRLVYANGAVGAITAPSASPCRCVLDQTQFH